MCVVHYIQARRNGLEKLPPNPNHHYTSNHNYEDETLDCSICGPSVPMKVQPNGRPAECMVPYTRHRAERRAREEAAGVDRKHPTYKRRRRYRLEMGGPERLLEEANHACLICREELTLDAMQIDHDHACCPTSKGGEYTTCGECTRGALCRRCNQALGLMRDNPVALRAAADYVELHAAKRLSRGDDG